MCVKCDLGHPEACDNAAPESSTFSVWKFKVPVGVRAAEFGTVMMPKGSEIVRVGSQEDDVFVWAIVDPNEAEPERHRLCALPTGFDCDRPSAVYLGTTEIYDGEIVVHVFEDMAAFDERQKP